eukprot:CAMPEP_0184487502 /NCGR_PEP_ID=MMETSP0113_2-20130426/10155_1 /TAXON_ID=91329 /ORGANISM="Norrisiella sphaerica, Strain BC52" /LENGTH=269 /DNA_ID=CAMNT_0026869837 /DNA_START=207 /DNA_END=1016 /DNA_ORIENTATION=+
MLPTNQSLVKYDNPVQLSTSKKKTDVKNKLTPTEDILNSILPPREWTENSQLWVQYVSSAPSTKKDVLMLQKNLDTKLQQNQARETGLCPIREELYSQAFDEIIRQVTINCAERGLLLLRVREELRMEISSFQTLYESSIAYGLRSALCQQQKRRETEEKLAKLASECASLEGKIKVQLDRAESMRKRAQDENVVMNERHNEDVTLIKNHNAMLRKTLAEKLSLDSEKKKDEAEKTKVESQKETKKDDAPPAAEEKEEKKKEEAENKKE